MQRMALSRTESSDGEEEGRAAATGADADYVSDALFNRSEWAREPRVTVDILLRPLASRGGLDSTLRPGPVESERARQLWAIVAPSMRNQEQCCVPVRLSSLTGRAKAAVARRLVAMRTSSTEKQRRACALHRHLVEELGLDERLVMKQNGPLLGLKLPLPMTALDVALSSPGCAGLRPGARDLASPDVCDGTFVPSPTSHWLLNLRSGFYCGVASLLRILEHEPDSPTSRALLAMDERQALNLLAATQHVGIIRARLRSLLSHAGVAPGSRVTVVAHCAGIAPEMEALRQLGYRPELLAATESTHNTAAAAFLKHVWRLSPTRHGAGLHLFDPADSYAEQLLRARLPRATLETVTPCCAGISSAPQIPGA